MMKIKVMKTIVTCLLVFFLMVPIISSCTMASPEPVAEPETLQWRLGRLVEQLEEQRQILHIPGMAIAIVQDDEVILTRGFGLMDLE